MITFSNEVGVFWESKIRTITKYETDSEVFFNMDKVEYSFRFYNKHLLYSDRSPSNSGYGGNGVLYGNFYEKIDDSGCFDCSYLEQFAVHYSGVLVNKNTSSVVVDTDTIGLNIGVESLCGSCKLRFDSLFPGDFHVNNYGSIFEDLKDPMLYFDDDIIYYHSYIRNTSGMVVYYLHYQGYKVP